MAEEKLQVLFYHKPLIQEVQGWTNPPPLTPVTDSVYQTQQLITEYLQSE
jgi:hypothetical protein